MYNRISIVGGSGSGKSTLCNILSKELNLPAIHLDSLNYKPNWVELDKNDYLIRKGEVENYIYFIESGIFRYWVSGMDSDKEVTCGFSFSCEFANAYSSLNNKELSVFNVQALCKSVIWRLSKRNLSYLYKTSLNINKIMRVTLEYAFARKTVRELSLLRYTPEERYVKLLEGDKMLLQNIPLKYIASYIGITPQALSCIRKRIT